jgi:hypothetical protein
MCRLDDEVLINVITQRLLSERLCNSMLNNSIPDHGTYAKCWPLGVSPTNSVPTCKPHLSPGNLMFELSFLRPCVGESSDQSCLTGNVVIVFCFFRPYP